MIIFQDCYNDKYTVNFYQDYIEIEINFIPKDKYNLDILYYNIEPYYMIDNTIATYNKKAFKSAKELKNYLYNKNR